LAPRHEAGQPQSLDAFLDATFGDPIHNAVLFWLSFVSSIHRLAISDYAVVEAMKFPRLLSNAELMLQDSRSGISSDEVS
jgi:hypothetical protein